MGFSDPHVVQKPMRKSVSSELLTYFENEWGDFLSQIVTADES